MVHGGGVQPMMGLPNSDGGDIGAGYVMRPLKTGVHYTLTCPSAQSRSLGYFPCHFASHAARSRLTSSSVLRS